MLYELMPEDMSTKMNPQAQNMSTDQKNRPCTCETGKLIKKVKVLQSEYTQYNAIDYFMQITLCL